MILLSGPVVLQLSGGSVSDDKGKEQPWPQLMHYASISCHWFGHVFWNSGILSML